ncbi:MAG: TlpA family protein disulfide reductase [Proteobacteria bacterium]|nr:TlpA family protein disulfide reductase [Pseudomonadota bacterium]
MTKKAYFGFVLAAVVILTVWTLRNHQAEFDSPSTRALAKIHDFDREKLRGSPYLLHFWAKWCEPCAEEIPHLVEFARKARFSKPLPVVAISLDPTLEEAKSLLPGQGRDLPSNFILALDPEHRAAEAMGSYQYPETYFIGADGQIIEKWIGAQKWQRPEVEAYFREKLK